MDIKAAIRSKRPFKIPKMTDHLYVKPHPNNNIDILYWLTTGKPCGTIPVEALLSENWVLMEIPNNIIKFPIKPIPKNKPEEAS